MVVFRPIAADDLDELRLWFEDAELSRRLSYPTADWFSYVTGAGNARCWIAEAEGEPVAQLQVDHVPGEPAYLDIAIRPALRGKGMGQLILSRFLDGPGRIYSVLIGYVEPDNFASLRCCQKCGFSLAKELDADGLIKVEFARMP